MRKMFISKRDRQFSVVQDVRKSQASYEYMVSDNPACAGRFFCEEYHPKPHDNGNISRCEAEANKLKKKVETIKVQLLHMITVYLMREQESYNQALLATINSIQTLCT